MRPGAAWPLKPVFAGFARSELPICSKDVSRHRLGEHDTPCFKIDGTAPLPTKNDESNSVLSIPCSERRKPRKACPYARAMRLICLP